MTQYLHTLFEEQVKLNPHTIALKFKDAEVTYQELDNQSNQLANCLVNKGVKLGDKVALFIERSINMVVGILGILKSGATYVPIDPKIPSNRFDFLLKDLNKPFFVSAKNKIESIEDVCRFIDLENISKESKKGPNINLDINSPAVILYTSGSTGYPKGVLISHKSLINRLIWDREKYKHSKYDIVLQHASYTFDFSILEIFMALANGGKLVLARPDFHYESFYLINLIQKEQITKMGSVPSLLKSYISLPEFEKCTSLKQVFLGGETLHHNLQNLFHKKSTAELVNIYGPTETTISVLNWTCKRNVKSKIVPIGFPVANYSIYLLNENNDPVPDGEVGEIYISGDGVSIGYLNRPELTKSKFIINPFTNNEKEYIYKTGDLARKLKSGAYQFIGRIDNQVKIRGLRVELEEIEHYLNLNKTINSCVVSKVEVDKRIEKLVAYVVPTSDDIMDIGSIKSNLSAHLPDYMVPSIFLQVKDLPLTPSGKVNREALPYPDKLEILSNTTYVPPKNEVQKGLVEIWEKVLNTKPVGIDDPFGDIGGDSLAMLDIHHSIETEMGYSIPISFLSYSITIRDLSISIYNKPLIEDPINYTQLYRSGKKTPIIYVQHIMGNLYPIRNIYDYLNSDHSIIVTMPFSINTSPNPETIEGFSLEYIKYLNSQFAFDDYIIVGYSIGGLIALEMASILKKRGKSVSKLFLIDTMHPKIIGPNANRYLFFSKTSFYIKQIFQCKLKQKKEIITHLFNLLETKVMNTIKKVFNLSSADDYQENLKAASEFKRLGNYHVSVARKYKPKPYHGDATLISAKPDQNTSIYFQPHTYNDNYWKSMVFNELQTYIVPATHTSIMKKPNIKIVANIINEHLSCDKS